MEWLSFRKLWADTMTIIVLTYLELFSHSVDNSKTWLRKLRSWYHGEPKLDN